MYQKRLLLLGALCVVFPTVTSAHPGGIDDRGGHYCVSNCNEYSLPDGYYHYHGDNDAGFDEDYVEQGWDDLYFEYINQPTYSSGWCRSKFGEGALGGIHECECKGGYEWNETKTQCVSDGVTTNRTTSEERMQLRRQRMTSSSTPSVPMYKVESVIDGDTIRVDRNGTSEKVRIIGIDTPETVDTQKPQECYGREASQYLKGWIEGKYIQMESNSDEDRDQYNRLLRYISFDGVDIGANMVRHGYAKSYMSYPHPRLALYEHLQSEAQEMDAGLWGACEKADERISFSDIVTFHPYIQAIRWAKQTEVVQGYLDGTFRPDEPINRAELLKLVLESVDADVDSVASHAVFTDVDSREWYAPYVYYAFQNSIIEGYPDGTFKPGRNISTAEALKIVHTTYGMTTKQRTGAWYAQFVESAREKALFYDDSISPGEDIKRKDVVWMLFSLLKDNEKIPH